MSTTTRCATCDKPKSAKAVVCPHCGATNALLDPRDHDAVQRKADRAKEAGGKGERSKLSSAEAGLLMETSAPERAFWADFFLPARYARGVWLWIDLALIVLTLPLILGVVVSLFRPPGEPRRTVTVSGLFAENVLVALLGGASVLAIGWHAEQLAIVGPIVGVATLALAARVWIRVAKPT